MTGSDTLPEPAHKLNVALGERSYDILIGPDMLKRLGHEVATRFPGARCAIITDANLARRHLDSAIAALQSAGVDQYATIVQPGERSKSWESLMQVVDALLNGRLERGDIVVALGGGVIGDLAGFAAAITRRGMAFIQVPTSMLAQVDSSVGGKTGINANQGKNLVGAFHQPALVLSDTNVLTTLPIREFRAGYAEVAKIAVIGDRPFFDWLNVNREAILEGGPERGEAIARACQAKADVVAADERESGRRALLNLGHTFGHALESAARYDASRLVHGEAVAIGTALAMRYSQEQGLCPAEDANHVIAHLDAMGLPTRLDQIPGDPFEADQLMTYIGQDKTVSRGRLTFILSKGISDCFIANDVDPDSIRAFLGNMLTGL